MIPQWLHQKLEDWQDWIMILFILSSIFSLLGVSMPLLLSQLINISPIFGLQIIAILNTIITFIVISWGLKKKRNLIQIGQILKDNNMKFSFVGNEIKIKWNQEPDENQKRRALAEINEILKKNNIK
jgi:hypothetical protein